MEFTQSISGHSPGEANGGIHKNQVCSAVRPGIIKLTFPPATESPLRSSTVPITLADPT
jgi:hypothetical protein